ncbi:hypothetical protein J6590_066146 [Homalodisca vitripennis]|nr:hypothetical protein J6590_066146 [Homalodisca vitripennis]
MLRHKLQPCGTPDCPLINASGIRGRAADHLRPETVRFSHVTSKTAPPTPSLSHRVDYGYSPGDRRDLRLRSGDRCARERERELAHLLPCRHIYTDRGDCRREDHATRCRKGSTSLPTQHRVVLQKCVGGRGQTGTVTRECRVCGLWDTTSRSAWAAVDRLEQRQGNVESAAYGTQHPEVRGRPWTGWNSDKGMSSLRPMGHNIPSSYRSAWAAVDRLEQRQGNVESVANGTQHRVVLLTEVRGRPWTDWNSDKGMSSLRPMGHNIASSYRRAWAAVDRLEQRQGNVESVANGTQHRVFLQKCVGGRGQARAGVDRGRKK